MFIYALTSIVVKTAELLMLKCNLNIGPGALIIAESELLNKQRLIAQWEQSLDAFVICASEIRRIILPLKHFITLYFFCSNRISTASNTRGLQQDNSPLNQYGSSVSA